MASTTTSGVFSANTAKTVLVSSQIAAKQKSMSELITEIETIANDLQTGWDASYTSTVKSSMKNYIKSIRTKQETLANNTEKYLGFSVELSTSTEENIVSNASLFITL